VIDGIGDRASDLFEVAADGAPAATAVRCHDVHLRYDELDALANGLAHDLAARGVGPGRNVAVAVGRGPELIVALLGVWKSGACVVPIDPAYPKARIEMALADVAPDLMLVSEAAASLATTVPTLAVSLAGPQRQQRPGLRQSVAAPAYIIFTSGSTGRPKGVVVPHRGLANLVEAQRRVFQVSSASRVIQFASLAFDASMAEILVTLASGAELAIPRETDLGSLSALEAFLREHAVTVGTFPPSVLELLDPARLTDLATVVTAGERCPPGVVRRWATGRTFLNAYGPTETTVCATMGTLSPDDELVTIGRPMDGVAIHLLDGLSPVADGAIGEIAIGGRAVADGYWRRPAQTAEAFVPDPFATRPGARMYRTGDFARRLPDGRIDFVGRRDEQTKVAGHRIEAAEVERALAADPAVLGSIVMTIGRSADAELVGFLRVAASSGLDAPAVRKRVAELLPPYMVPGRILFLSEWPLSPNGKVDRKRLEELLAEAPATVAEAAGDATSHEREVRSLWTEVLGRPPSAADVDFFMDGGSSLKLFRLLAAIEARFGRRLATGAAYAGPITVRSLAALATHDGEPDDSSMLAFNTSSHARPLFLIPPVVGDAMVFAALARHLRNRPVYGLRAPGLDGGPLAEEMGQVARSYASRIRAIQPEGPYLLGGYSLGGIYAFAVVRALADEGQEVELLLLLDSTAAATAPNPAFEAQVDGFSPAMMAFMCSRMLAATVGEVTTLSFPALKPLAEAAILEQFHAEMVRIGVLAVSSTVADAARRLAVFRAILRTGSTYVATPYGGLVALIASEGGHPFARGNVKLFDWSPLLVGEVLRATTPGDHFTVLAEENLPALATVIESMISAARER
jgi:amino acid adenylation domain-containing protein